MLTFKIKQILKMQGYRYLKATRLLPWSRTVNYCAGARYLGQPTAESHPHLIEKGQVTRGVSKAEYEERRSKFWNLCRVESEAKSSLIVIPAAGVAHSAPDVPYPFRQDSNFFYLSGFLEPDSILVLYGNREQFESALFVAERNAQKELWDGAVAGEEGAKWLTGVAWAAAYSSFTDFVQEYTRSNNCQVRFVANARTSNNGAYRKALDSLKASSVKISSALNELEELRWRKSIAEVELIRKACAIGSAAMTSTINYSAAGQTEGILSAHMDLNCRCLGAERLAYPPVVGAGDRATTIHYLHADQIIKDGELILMDAGCEFGGYVSDITRTWPASNAFDSTQAILYDILYDCQVQIIQGFKEHRLNDIFSAYCEMLARLGNNLQEIGLLPPGLTAHELMQRVGQFCPHDIGHYMGLDVHDTATVAKDRQLQAGVVITVEPGIYFPAHATHVPASYRGIGMRLEDDLLITDTGAEVLTAACPKSRSEIQALRLNSRRQ